MTPRPCNEHGQELCDEEREEAEHKIGVSELTRYSIALYSDFRFSNVMFYTVSKNSTRNFAACLLLSM
jgi:hypothetical protein